MIPPFALNVLSQTLADVKFCEVSLQICSVENITCSMIVICLCSRCGVSKIPCYRAVGPVKTKTLLRGDRRARLQKTRTLFEIGTTVVDIDIAQRLVSPMQMR